MRPGAPAAGQPGMAFAGVLPGADGARMVPHHRAVDVVADNRLLPGGGWTGDHAFAASCEAPVVTARLVWRQAPMALQAERGWDLPDRRMAEVVR